MEASQKDKEMKLGNFAKLFDKDESKSTLTWSTCEHREFISPWISKNIFEEKSGDKGKYGMKESNIKICLDKEFGVVVEIFCKKCSGNLKEEQAQGCVICGDITKNVLRMGSIEVVCCEGACQKICFIKCSD